MSEIIENGKFRTTFGKLINCQALGDIVDVDFLNSCMPDSASPGSFNNSEEFLEFIKQHFDTEVECEYEFNNMDSCYYVDFEINSKAFCLPFWDDELYADIHAVNMDAYDTGDEEFDIEYWRAMMNDFDQFYDKPNF